MQRAFDQTGIELLTPGDGEKSVTEGGQFLACPTNQPITNRAERNPTSRGNLHRTFRLPRARLRGGTRGKGRCTVLRPSSRRSSATVGVVVTQSNLEPYPVGFQGYFYVSDNGESENDPPDMTTGLAGGTDAFTACALHLTNLQLPLQGDVQIHR